MARRRGRQSFRSDRRDGMDPYSATVSEVYVPCGVRVWRQSRGGSVKPLEPYGALVH
jgi:hypothetical protein